LELDYPTDRFHVTFDLNKVTPEDMLETVRKQGLEGDIVHDEFR